MIPTQNKPEIYQNESNDTQMNPYNTRSSIDTKMNPNK